MLRLKYYINYWIIWQVFITTLPWALRLETGEHLNTEAEQCTEVPQAFTCSCRTWEAAEATAHMGDICIECVESYLLSLIQSTGKNICKYIGTIFIKITSPSFNHWAPAGHLHVYFSFWMEASSCQLSPHSKHIAWRDGSQLNKPQVLCPPLSLCNWSFSEPRSSYL